MGLLEGHREHEFQKEHAEWTSHVQDVREMDQMAHTWTGVPVDPNDGIIGKPGEKAYLTLTGAGLIEPRRLPGHYTGRSQGFSIPVYKGIRYRVGSTKGTFQQGAEVPTPIDTGIVLISDLRVVFAGSKATREWLYPKLIGFHHDDALPWTALQVSNRGTVSGILYTEQAETTVRFRLQLALAQFSGSRATFAASIDQQQADLITAEPTPPPRAHPAAAGSAAVAQAAPSPPTAPTPRTAPPLPPAGWYPNPEGPGRRYWDGAAWTTNTAP